MPHLAGKCDCGRNIHFPKNATIGYQWKCFTCGKVWVLSNQGKPLHNKRSKAPPKNLSPSYPESTSQKTTYNKQNSTPKSSNNSGSGCGQIIMILAIIFILCLILTSFF